MQLRNEQLTQMKESFRHSETENAAMFDGAAFLNERLRNLPANNKKTTTTKKTDMMIMTQPRSRFARNLNWPSRTAAEDGAATAVKSATAADEAEALEERRRVGRESGLLQTALHEARKQFIVANAATAHRPDYEDTADDELAAQPSGKDSGQ